MKIHILDLNFRQIPETIAAYLIETSKGPVLIESGPYSTFENLTKGVANAGHAITDIKHVFLTHIHLDHAGAAWKLAEHGATIYVHPRGAKHLANPDKLWASAKQIYKDQMEVLWGDMQAIPSDQLYEMEDYETVELGDTTLKAHHTPGHAVHHLSFEIENDLFTGDVGGICIQNGPILPPCPPPDIDLEAWRVSIDRLKNLSAKNLYPTHFGKHEASADYWDMLERELDIWASWVKNHLPAEDLDALVPSFIHFIQERQRAQGISEEIIKKNELANPSWMSVYGLARYWTKKAKQHD